MHSDGGVLRAAHCSALLHSWDSGKLRPGEAGLFRGPGGGQSPQEQGGFPPPRPASISHGVCTGMRGPQILEDPCPPFPCGAHPSGPPHKGTGVHTHTHTHTHTLTHSHTHSHTDCPAGGQRGVHMGEVRGLRRRLGAALPLGRDIVRLATCLVP